MKPLLAASMVKKAADFSCEQLQEQLEKLSFPVLCSPKIDGIRVLLHADPRCPSRTIKALTRSMKPVRNTFIQNLLCQKLGDSFLNLPALRYMDGEILVRNCKKVNKDKNKVTEFQATTSGVMSIEGEPDFHYFVFDYMFQPDAPFNQRLQDAQAVINRVKENYCNTSLSERISFLPHDLVYSVKDILKYEKRMLKAGYEGIMIRDPLGIYKFGRSTFNEGILIKMKRFEDDEAYVIGYEPKYTNTNESKINEVGASVRSGEKAGLLEEDTLGALVVQGFSGKFKNVQFRIGSGFDDNQRLHIWHNKDKYLGKVVTYNYQPYNIKDAPRFPVFKDFREDLEVEENLKEEA